jgi:hypothetical protein
MLCCAVISKHLSVAIVLEGFGTYCVTVFRFVMAIHEYVGLPPFVYV